METSFYGWVRDVAARFTQALGVSRQSLAEEFDMLTQQQDPFIEQVKSDYIAGALQTRGDIEFTLDFLDYLVAKLTEYEQNDLIESLDSVLTLGGSEWTVGVRGGYGAIEKRVSNGVRQTADQTITQSATAGDLLGESWHAAFGRNPDPEEAYEKAIKAVEEASAAIVLPRTSLATLGNIASTMRDQGDWKLALEEDAKNPSSDVVTKMVRALWSGQESRHGGNGYRKPTQEEAEAAVLLAVPLVHWFTTGAVQRRP